MKKLLFIVNFILLSQISIYAQQDGIFSMYWNNISFENPAETGVNYAHRASYMHRQQWTGITGAPKTHQLIYDSKLPGINSGLGINYTYLNLGYETDQYTNLNYAYHLQISESKTLSFGIAGGAHSIRTSAQWIAPDPGIVVNNSNNTPPNFKQTKLNLNAGVFYKSDRLQVGIGGRNLTQSNFENLNIKGTLKLSTFASYIIEINDRADLIPSMFIKTDLKTVSTNLNFLLEYDKMFWVGAGYRVNDAFSIMGGIDFKEKYRLGYNFDYSPSKLQIYSNATHEILLALIVK